MPDTIAPTPAPATPARVCFLVIKGTAPRCRKVDTHIVKLGTHAVDVDPASLMPQARAILSGYKGVQRAKLCLHYTEIKREPGGVAWQTTALFDSRHVEIPHDAWG
jgi:hypothetical protein